MSAFLKAPLQTIIILLLLSEISNAAKVAAFHDGSSHFSKRYFSNFTLLTKNESLYLDMMIVEPLVFGFKAKLDIQLRLSESKDYQTMFSTTLDVCSLIITFKNNLFKKWYKSLLKHGNFKETCPILNGHYYINGWKLDSELLPPFLYPGDYRIKLYCYMGKYKSKTEIYVADLLVSTLIRDA